MKKEIFGNCAYLYIYIYIYHNNFDLDLDSKNLFDIGRVKTCYQNGAWFFFQFPSCSKRKSIEFKCKYIKLHFKVQKEIPNSCSNIKCT